MSLASRKYGTSGADRNSELIADDPFSASIYEASITYRRLYIAWSVTIAIISEIKLSSNVLAFLFSFFFLVSFLGFFFLFLHPIAGGNERFFSLDVCTSQLCWWSDFYANNFPIIDNWQVFAWFNMRNIIDIISSSYVIRKDIDWRYLSTFQDDKK